MDWQDDQRSLQNNDAIPVPICEHIFMINRIDQMAKLHFSALYNGPRPNFLAFYCYAIFYSRGAQSCN